MDKTEPIPVGTTVDYHGSHTHGRYVIIEHRDPGPLFTEKQKKMIEGAFGSGALRDAYPDGVAYTILPEGMEPRFGNMRTFSVSRVRRESLTVVNDEQYSREPGAAGPGPTVPVGPEPGAEVMDRMNRDKVFGWLISHGIPDKDAAVMLMQAAADGESVSYRTADYGEISVYHNAKGFFIHHHLLP